MNNESIKEHLAAHGLHLWQLCKQLGICRSTYYFYSHNGFKGHKTAVKKGVKKLIAKKDGDK